LTAERRFSNASGRLEAMNNTVTLGAFIPESETDLSRLRAQEQKKSSNLSKKVILILFRFLIFAIVFIFSFYNIKNTSVIFDFRIFALSAAYAGSIAVMFFLNPRHFEGNKLLSFFFITDTIFVVSGIYLAGIAETELSLIFFMTVFISALSQDVRSVFSVAIVSCSIYAFLHYRITGEFWSTDTAYLVRFPFLFVASAMSGYMAVESKKNTEERKALVSMNHLMRERVEVSKSELFETNQKLNLILEYHHRVLASLKSGVVVVDKAGTVTTFNRGAQRILGLPETETTPQRLKDLPDNLKPVVFALERTLEEETGFVQDHLELKTIRSEIVPVTLETSVLRNSANEIIGAIATFRDMTLLRQMESQLLRSERLTALGQIAAGVAHEIKNPLNSVLGFSKRLSEHMVDPKMKKYADVIVEEVHRIDTIVNDVLEYSRLDQILKIGTDIHQLLDEVVDFLSDKIDLAGVEVERVYADALPRCLIDPAKIRQVFLNLMLNAVQAMEKGGQLTLTTRLIDGLAPESSGVKTEGDVFQQLFLHQQMVSVSVGDTGSGITKENLGKLFHPFFTTKVTGTGLGLSICHKIVVAHGGSLSVDSELGKGSRFVVNLPIE
jgi:PAS domain S-box-containing protein